MLKRAFGSIAMAVLLIAAGYAPVTAVPGAQQACAKAGIRTTIAGTKFVCTATPRGLMWARLGKGTGERLQQGAAASAPSSGILWTPTADGWRANGNPPRCPSPLALNAPVDVSKVTSILYPGQTRGGNYKPHGGFRFDSNADNVVAVRAPMAGSVVLGARYLVSGEVQYTFDIMSPCGIMNRLGHLLELAPRMQAIAAKFPAPLENDSRTTFVSPPVPVTAGELLATKVGVTKPSFNVFLDWGLFDYRTSNASAANSAWAAQHANDLALTGHALCWLELLPSAQKARVTSLPAGDPGSGKSSDYCAQS